MNQANDPAALLDQLYSRKAEFLADDRFRTIADAEAFFTKIVGVSFEGRQAIVGGLRAGDELRLTRQPANPYDANAVAVEYGALSLGFLRREIAGHLAAVLDAGRRYRVEVASVTGGGPRSTGVNILVQRDDVQLRRAMDAPLPVGAKSFAEIQTALIGERPLRAAQTAVIERILSGKKTLAVLGTGRGKSLCFQLPATLLALQQRKKTVVLYPLRALANDQFEALTMRLVPLGMRILRATGAIDAAERETLNAAFETGAWDMILTTPEFIQFHADRFLLVHNRPSLIVVDEAHHVFEARHRPAYRNIGRFLAEVKEAAVLALTATARTECFTQLVEILGIESWVIDPTVRDNLHVIDARGTKDRLAYLRALLEPGHKAIIYCNSRSEATKVAELLRVSYPRTAYYHAGVATELRLAVEDGFRRGDILVVVATSAFGEGIDLPDVRDVVLYHLNFSFIEFNQQSGRAGRDGQDARIHLLYGEPDRRINDFIIAKTAPTIPLLRELYRGLRGLCDEALELRMTYADIARTLELDRADETTVSVAVRIFADAGLLEVRQSDDGRLIRFESAPPKVDLAQTPRFAEGEAERENFNRFCAVAMDAADVDLERILNRPIYPDGVPLLK